MVAHLHLLLCSDRQLFWPSNVPVFQIKVFIKVLIGCDGRGVVHGGTLSSEVLLSQKSGESGLSTGFYRAATQLASLMLCQYTNKQV